jgi:carboxylesterase
VERRSGSAYPALLIVLLRAATAVAGLGLLLRAQHRRRWRRAEQRVLAQFSLGTDGVIAGAQAIEGGRADADAVLLLHGFGDTPQSLAGLAERLQDAGWFVSAPLLPGHGRTLAEFHASDADAWIAGARAAYSRLKATHGTVMLCGQSMGAALAIDLAVDERPPALVLLAPYIAMPGEARAGAYLWPLLQGLVPVLHTRDERSIRDPGAAAQSRACGHTTPKLLWELLRVVRRARARLPGVQSPTLIVHSREDNLVAPEDVAQAAARLGHPVKALRWVTGCGHVISADACRNEVAAAVLDWLQRCRDTAVTR